MKDNTDRTKEMTIYQSECGINTVDVFHFIAPLVELQSKHHQRKMVYTK